MRVYQVWQEEVRNAAFHREVPDQVSLEGENRGLAADLRRQPRPVEAAAHLCSGRLGKGLQ